MSSKNSYRSIISGIIIFGGTQLMAIFLNILRGKLVAIILGSEGMGINAIYQNLMNVITQFVGLGISISAVKEISQTLELDQTEITVIVKIVRKLVFFTAILGLVITVIGSPWFSYFSFGSDNYVIHISLLSIAICFTILSTGEMAILQGARRLKHIAISSIVAPSVGLCISVPIYYNFGFSGIIPAMILLSFITYSVNFYFSKKIKTCNIKVAQSQFLSRSKKMISLGFVMILGSLVGTLCIYILYAFIRSVSGSETEVGLTQAATSITNQYIGVVFSAMSIDFFPRLVALRNDNLETKLLVQRQTEIVLLIIAPLSLIIITATPLIIEILFTSSFLDICVMLRWLALGVILKVVSSHVGYIPFARGDKKIFLFMEVIFFNMLVLFTNLFSYYFFGLVGLGISYVISYLIYLVVVLFITKKYYGIQLEIILLFNVAKIFALACIALFSFEVFDDTAIAYIISSIILIIVSIYSIKELDKKIFFLSAIKHKFNSLK